MYGNIKIDGDGSEYLKGKLWKNEKDGKMRVLMKIRCGHMEEGDKLDRRRKACMCVLFEGKR